MPHLRTIVLVLLLMDASTHAEVIGGGGGGGGTKPPVYPASCLTTTPEFHYPLNFKTGEGLLALPLGQELHTLPLGVTSTIPSGNGVSSAVTDIFFDPVKLVVTYLNPCTKFAFTAGSTAGTYVPVLPGPYRLLTANSDGTFTLYFVSDGNRDYYMFNSAGYVVQIVRDNVVYWQITYDSSNRVSSITDSNGNSKYYTYTNGLLSSVKFAGRTFNYSYDSSKNLISVAGAAGTFVSIAYFSNKQPSSITYNDTGDGVTLSYNTNGTMASYQRAADSSATSVTYGTGVVSVSGTGVNESYTFDSNNRTIQDSDSISSMTKTYTYWDIPSGSFYSDVPASLKIVRTVNGCSIINTTQYSNFNSLGQPGQVAHGGVSDTAYSYNGNGQKLTETLPGVATRTMAYDSRGLVTSISGGGVSTTFTYDSAGYLASRSSGGFTMSYTNDGYGKVLQETSPDGTFNYTYLTGFDGYIGSIQSITYPNGTSKSTSINFTSSGTAITVTTTPVGSDSPTIGTYNYSTNWVPAREETASVFLFPAANQQISLNQATTTEATTPSLSACGGGGP